MDVSGVSTGVVAATATNNGDNAIGEVVKKTLDTESQTDTQTADAVSQPTKATEGNLGTRFNGSA
jgi:ferritin-like metal-binding protein YciE